MESRDERSARIVVPSLWSTLRAAVSAFTDDFSRFFAANVVWSMVALAVTLVAQFHLALSSLTLLLVPTTMAIARMAATTVRGVPARLDQARDGALHRSPTTLLIGLAQLTLLVIAWLNVQIGIAATSLVIAAGGVVAGWVLLIVLVLAVAWWPLLLDPSRDEVGTRRLWRLALAVVAARPGRVLAVVVIEVVITIVVVQTIVGALLLPSVGVLIAAHAIVPVADALEGRRDDTAG